MAQWEEIGETQENTVGDNSVSNWKDVLYRYSDKAISAIAEGGMRTGDPLADDRRQRAAMEIVFNRSVDSGDINNNL